MAAPGKCLWFLVWQLCICSCPQRANRSRLHVQVEARPTVRTFIKTVREIKMVSAACTSSMLGVHRLKVHIHPFLDLCRLRRNLLW